MARVHNFNAGPAAMPLPALERAQAELLDLGGTGMSVLEHSHRGAAYERVHDEALGLLRSLLAIPDSHEVLFLQGGASQQFAQVPLNLLPPGRFAQYVVTGGWSEKALAEAQLVGDARALLSTGIDGKYTRVPAPTEVHPDPAAAYLHVTSNNTLFGTQFHAWPDPGAVPLVADMSSDLLWAPLEVSRFGLIYAGAQKNIGPSGLVVVIVRKDLVAAGRKDVPRIFRYATHAEARSLYHTPPTFSVYLVRNVLAWLASEGGLAARERVNRAKGDALYGALDALAGFYAVPAERGSRSYMNVVFRTPSASLDAKLAADAEAAGLVGLRGHRTTGGLRASIYNAVSLASVEALVAFLREFARVHG